ncbi:MAG: hypothetical protein J2P28_23080 [Actinobacteria bacterium]|nr:hypothetical protein [Actinomycetota bacterium]
MTSAASRRSWVITELARKIADVVGECNGAARRMAELSTAADRYLPGPDKAPDTYADFLYRTSGLLAHEPSARARATAHR